MTQRSKAATVALWVLRVLIAAAFLAAGFMKLSGQPMMVAEFDHVGLGQWFRCFTGLMELVGGLAVLIPAVSAYGAMVVLVVDIGAFVALVAVLHMDWIHAVVIGLILGVLIYLHREVFTSCKAPAFSSRPSGRCPPM
ncbi:DoxX family protein [Falsirhodobacter sp. 1013]|uniref:DoxX family protein n=1 Tax=Falsirhodobacter sp. 1013 TaxID=3417566 RepID=UPI003EB7BB99